MPRDLGYPLYAMRRLYGLCWSSVYYFKPLYHLCLSLRPLRWLLFRLFGYRGSLDFTAHPDTWIRDLPLLELGQGAYLASRATIGTNIVLSDGEILVDRVRIGAGSLVGQLAVVAPGARIGDGVEIGVGAAVGIGVEVGDGARVGPRAEIDHGARLGRKARIGTSAYLGARVVVGERASVGPAVHLAKDARVRTRRGHRTRLELLSSTA